MLSRRTGESIFIGDSVKVTVTYISGGQVKLGIEAPKNITVDRSEVHQKKNAEKIDNDDV